MAIILNKITNVCVTDGEKQIFKNNEPLSMVGVKTDLIATSLVNTSSVLFAEDGSGNKLTLELKSEIGKKTGFLNFTDTSNVEHRVFETTKDEIVFNVPARGLIPVSNDDFTTKTYTDNLILETNNTVSTLSTSLTTRIDSSDSKIVNLGTGLGTANSDIMLLDTFTNNINTDLIDLTSRVDVVESVIPTFSAYLVGEYKFLAGNATPAKFLLCDGAEVLRDTYSALFAIIGVSFGSTSGTTFKLPDLRGRVLAASSATYPIGTSAGNNTQVLTTGQLPTHTHTPTITGAAAYTGSSAQRYIKTGTRADNAVYYGGASGSAILAYHPANNETFSAIDSQATHTHSITISNTGNGDTIDMRQPTLYAGNWYIYTGV